MKIILATVVLFLSTSCVLAEKPLLYVHICGWHDDPKGGQCIYIKPDGDQKVYDLVWFEAGDKVVITKWFTTGDSRFIASNKKEAAWKDHTPGVFKMEYDPKILNELFPGKKVE